MYKVTTPLRLGPGTTTIRKAVGTIQGIWQGDSETYELPELTRKTSDEEHGVKGSEEVLIDGVDDEPRNSMDVPTLEGHFAFFAQIEFRAFSDSRFRYNSLDVPVNTYFRKLGWSWLGRVRVFKASDGQEYRWERRVGGSYKLFKNDSNAQVGKYEESRPHLGPILKGRQGSFEVDPCCEPILDELIMTFVYIYVREED